EFEHHLARELRLVAQRAAVERVQRALVAVEHNLDFFTGARRLAAGAGALHLAAGVRIEARPVFHARRGVLADLAGATAEAARQAGVVDAARGLAGLRIDEAALRASVLNRGLELRILDVQVLIAQVREGIFECARLLLELRFGLFRRLLLDGFWFVGLRLLLRLRRRGRRRRFRSLDELHHAVRQILALDLHVLGSRDQPHQDSQQRRDDEQDAQQLLELALALLAQAERQFEAAEIRCEADAHAPAPGVTLRSRWITARETLP